MLKHILLVGAPGVGKGTFAKIFYKSQKWGHLSIGDLMREEVKNKTPVGLKIKDLLAAGRLVPDEVANQIAFDYMASLKTVPGAYRGVLLDGYPRTVSQAELLLNKVDPASVVAMHLKMDQDIAVQKLLSRVKCTPCGQGFNTAHIVGDGYDMPALLPNPATCPLGPDCCKPVFERRSDDTKETIEKRFAEFYALTEPVLAVFRRRGLLKEFTVRKGVADAPELLKMLLDDKAPTK